MINRKYFALYFNYNYILLFAEKNGKFENINFANGERQLANCIGYSYDKEDLVFLPDGDPFDVNTNSSFSDYLDFAGYHFDSTDAILEIGQTIVKNKLIPGMNKDDELIFFMNNSYFEYDELREKEPTTTSHSYGEKEILFSGHRAFICDIEIAFKISIELMRHTFNHNILFADQFIAEFMNIGDDYTSFMRCPTLEREAVDTIRAKYPKKSQLPETLYRNIKNRIIVAKLFNQPIPKQAIYRNQIVDISHLQLAERFDEIMDMSAKKIIKAFEDTNKDITFVFDLGMHPTIKQAFMSLIKEPIFLSETETMEFLSYLLRNSVIEHEITSDLGFKMFANMNTKTFRKELDIYGSGSNANYNLRTVLEPYIKKKNIKNPFKNKETDKLKEIMNKKIINN